MKLLLTSQGLQEELKDTFLSLLTKSPNNIKVLFVTTAAYGESDVKPAWLDVYIKQLQDCGITQIMELDIRNKSKEELEHVVSETDIILVNGGNTFFLLYWIKKTGFDKMIKKAIDKGKLYVGISAGSYICCPTIEQASWKHGSLNTINLIDLTGLNYVPFLIFAHFEEKYRSMIEEASKTTSYPVVCLNNTQAILVKDNLFRLVGKGKKEVFYGTIVL